MRNYAISDKNMNITLDNYQEAHGALRAIFMMYWDLINSYNGFGHNIETGTFKAVEFIDCEITEKPGYALGLDKELLQTGAAIAILCGLSDAWDEQETWDVKWPLIQQAKLAFDGGKFRNYPEIQKGFELGFSVSITDGKFYRQLKTIYEKYVIGYFERLLANR